MNGSLIDTNVIVQLLKNSPDAVTMFQNIKEPYVSVTVVGELMYGLYKSSKQEENKTIIEGFLETVTILDVDNDTAESYAQIKNQLYQDSYTLPENDIWIAAVAQQHGLSMATFDKHFGYIKSITIVSTN